MPPEQLKDFLHDRKGALAGERVAAQYGWKIGDVIPLRGTIYPGQWSFVLRGIYRGRLSDETAGLAIGCAAAVGVLAALLAAPQAVRVPIVVGLRGMG